MILFLCSPEPLEGPHNLHEMSKFLFLGEKKNRKENDVICQIFWPLCYELLTIHVLKFEQVHFISVDAFNP